MDADTSQTWAWTYLQARRGWLCRWVAGWLPRELRPIFDPEDVVQDVWLAAFRCPAFKSLRGPRNCDRWMMCVARRRMSRLGRAGAPRMGTASRRAAGAVLEELPARRPDPGREAELREAADAVRNAIAGLAARSRVAVQMRFFDELALATIAVTTGQSRPAIRGRLRRGLSEARARLRF